MWKPASQIHLLNTETLLTLASNIYFPKASTECKFLGKTCIFTLQWVWWANVWLFFFQERGFYRSLYRWPCVISPSHPLSTASPNLSSRSLLLSTENHPKCFSLSFHIDICGSVTRHIKYLNSTCLFFLLATPVALHSWQLRGSFSGSAEFLTSVAPTLASLCF